MATFSVSGDNADVGPEHGRMRFRFRVGYRAMVPVIEGRSRIRPLIAWRRDPGKKKTEFWWYQHARAAKSSRVHKRPAVASKIFRPPVMQAPFAFQLSLELLIATLKTLDNLSGVGENIHPVLDIQCGPCFNRTWWRSTKKPGVFLISR